jgi:acetyl-CoA acyltransferase 2
MAKLGKSIVIVGAKRTAFGTMQGMLKGVSATELGVHAAKAALAQSGIALDAIGHVIIGNVMQTSPDAIYCARHIGLKAGLPITTPAVTVNRLCGSGFEAVIQGAQQLLLGEHDAVLVGGTENMTQAPHVLRGAREGWPFGKAPAFEDSLWSELK